MNTRQTASLFTLTIVMAISASSAHSQDSGIIAPGATVQKLADGFRFTEGPATDSSGNVYFTDQPNDRIVRWDAETRSTSDWMKPCGRANGLYFDNAGNLIACADDRNELWSISPDKRVTVLITNYSGKLLNGPNDAWVHPDETIYFTDPLYKRPYWQRDPEMQQDGQHVYRFNPKNKDLVRVATNLKQPNGIIGTPDGRTLYVADIGDRKTYRYDIAEDGSLTNRRLHCEMGSDGMTLDHEGNLYLTGRGVTVFDKDGKQIEHIEVPERWTANITFGGKERDLLFITASEAVYGLKMRVKGAR